MHPIFALLDAAIKAGSTTECSRNLRCYVSRANVRAHQLVRAGDIDIDDIDRLAGSLALSPLLHPGDDRDSYTAERADWLREEIAGVIRSLRSAAQVAHGEAIGAQVGRSIVPARTTP